MFPFTLSRSAGFPVLLGTTFTGLLTVLSPVHLQAGDFTFGGLPEPIEQDVEEEIARRIAERAAQEAFERMLAEALEQQLLDTTEEAVEDHIEAEVEEAIVATAEDAITEADTILEGSENSDLLPPIEDTASIESNRLLAASGFIEPQLDEFIESFESVIDVNDEKIHRGEWLVMAAPSVFDELAEEGYLFENFTDLPSLGLKLAEVEAPATFDLPRTRDGIVDVVGAGRVQVDMNHIYTAGSIAEVNDLSVVDGVNPLEAMRFPDAVDTLNLKIGVIDSDVDLEHEAFKTSSIATKKFTGHNTKKSLFHGTAVASIIVAEDDDSEFRGLAPRAELFSAAVFEDFGDAGDVASTVSLVKALDWMIANGVDVVNVSLAGPPNRLLEIALEKVAGSGITVLAAAGNGGPMARPKYPAAYPSVLAITAVDANGRAFRLANRGDYLDLAAPGVNVRHARSGGGYAVSSGTSFAVPFATTAAAVIKKQHPTADVFDYLVSEAVDLGDPGRDDVYGHGLLQSKLP